MIFRSANYKTLKRVLLQSTLFGVIFTTVLFGVGGVAGFGKVFAASDCDSNAVIYCGVSTVGEVQSKYASGDGRNSATSIQRIFSGFSISSADIQAMNSTAKNGSVSRNGNVYFGDKLVATGAMTAGRQDMPGSTAHNNQGTVYYKRPPSVSFASSPLDAYVMMKDGVFQFAIIKSCGNPVSATPKTTPPPTTPPPAPQPQPQPQPTPQPTPTPTPPPTKPPEQGMCSGNTTNSNSNGVASQGGNCSINTTTVVQQIQQTPPPAPPETPSPSGQCTNLNVTAAAGSSTAMTVNAAVTYTTQNGATLQNITYDFGDNVTIPPTTATNMSHTYQQSGSYTITATLTFSGPSGTPTTTTVSTSTAANNSNNSNSAIPTSVCQASITVAPAPTPPTPQPTPTPTPTPPPAAPATVTPAGATTTTPTQTTTEVPSKLVATGAGSIAGLFAITTIVSGLAYSYFIRRRLAV